jgi:predicted methyltransferase
MKLAFYASIAALGLTGACSSPPPPPPPAQPPPPPPVSAAAVEAPPPLPAPTAAPPAEPTPEEKKKADALRELQEDRDKFEADFKTESARWTPEVHAAAKAVADKSYPTGHAAIQAAMAGKQRRPGDSDRDKYRHPLETLDFMGFKPTMTVLEYGPGEGWYTSLLAPALAQKGKLLATTTDWNGPADDRATFYGHRYKVFLDMAPEVYGKVQPVITDNKTPKLGLDQSVDMVLVFRGLHGMENAGKLGEWLAEIHKALKPKGILGIEAHRANPDAEPVASSKKGYLPEPWVISQIEAAGFKLAGKSEINANPKDTKDYPEGVWALPPTYRMKDKDHDKYAAIGESDRMTLKFIKVTPATPVIPKPIPSPQTQVPPAQKKTL